MRNCILLLFFINLTLFALSQKTEMIVQLGHTDRVTCVDYSSNGEYIITGGMDQVLKLWEVKTGFLVRTFKGHKGMVYQVKFSPDNKFLYSCSYDDNSFLKWDVTSGTILTKMHFANNAISDFSLSKDGALLAACGKDSVLILKSDLTIKKKLPVVNPEKSVFSANNEFLYIASDDFSNPSIGVYAVNGFKKIDEVKSISGLDYMSVQNGNISISNYKEVKLINLSTKVVKGIAVKDSVNIVASLLMPNGSSMYYSLSDGRIYFVDNAGNISKIKAEHTAMISELVVSTDGKYLITASYDWSSQIIETATGKNIKWFRSKCDYINHFDLSETGGKIAVSTGNMQYGNQIGVWDLLKANIKMSDEKLSSSNLFLNLDFNEKMNAVIAANSNGQSYWYNFPKSTTSWSFMSGNSLARCAALTPNGKNGVIGTKDGKLIFWRPERNKNEVIDLTTDGITSVEISPNGLKVIVGTDNGQVYVVNYTDKVTIFKIESHSVLAGYSDTTWVMSYGSVTRMNINSNSNINLNSISISDISFNQAGDQIAVCGGNWINIFDITTGNLIKRIVQNGAGFGCIDFSNDGSRIVASGADGIVRVFESESGKALYELSGHQNEVRAVSFSLKEQFIISGSLDAQLKIWDLKTSKELLSFITAKGGKEFIIYNSEGYYYASKGASQLVSYRIGQKIFPFEQFDLQYSRPDLIMKSLSLFTTSDLELPISTNLIKSYNNAYKKRLQLMNFQESSVKELHAPVLLIKKDLLKISSNDSLLNLQISASDSKYELMSLHVLVNGVPIYGILGIPLKGKEIIKNLNIILGYGANKVSAYCVNQYGVKSLVDNFEVFYSSENEKSKVYYIGIGVQEYIDSNFNLLYSVKDVTDVAQIFAEKYPESERFVLANEQVTRENILKLKDVLMKTSVNDEVIVLLSGHGLLSEELDFYYATHDVNFTNPKENGIAFEEIESILNGIPARKKMIFLDACHSGELDKSELAHEPVSNGPVEGKTFGAKGQKMMMGLSNSFELMKELFSDLQTGTGTTIIASSSGKYFSYEFDEYKNGVFTYSLKAGLNGKADSDDNGIITVSELQSFLSKSVVELTKGKQEPTSREVNLDLDWSVWK